MLRAKGVLVQADYLRLSPHVVNGHNVEPNWALLQVALAQKCMRGAHQDVLKQQIHRAKPVRWCRGPSGKTAFRMTGVQFLQLWLTANGFSERFLHLGDRFFHNPDRGVRLLLVNDERRRHSDGIFAGAERQ